MRDLDPLRTINEAIHCLHESVGAFEAIDTAMRHGADHPIQLLLRRLEIPALPAAR